MKTIFYPDIEQQCSLKHGGLSGDFLDDLRREKDDPAFTDEVLVCQGEEIPCHRVFLGASSDVFRKMFLQKDFTEGSNQFQRVNMLVISSDNNS